jgi:predicted dehydrogenase
MNKQPTIRVALIGCGGVVGKYRRSYLGIAGARVVATVDANAQEAEKVAVELGASRFSTELAAAFEEDVDAVVISTPNNLHAEHACAALGAGKHVLLQKPMARTAGECAAILNARRSSGKQLGMYMNLLEHPLFHDLSKLIRDGHLGDVALFSARLAHRGGLGWGGVGQNWRASRTATGGGSFIQLGVHYQHLMRWLLGQQVVGCQAMSTNFACKHLEGDDLALVQYRLSGGSLGEIQTSWCCQEEHVSVLGTKGSFHYRDNEIVEYSSTAGEFHGECLHLRGDGSTERIAPLIPPAWDDFSNPYNQHRRFIEALQSGKPCEVSGEEGMEDVRLVEQIYELAEKAAAGSSSVSLSNPILDSPAGSYRWREDWASVPRLETRPENGRTHGVAIGRAARVYVFHQAVPAMLIYAADGHLLTSWGSYPSAHGLTLVEERGEEFLWLTDQERAVVEKTTTDGKIVSRIEAPAYTHDERYVPTWVAVNEVRHGGNGDVWVADGYGSHRVSRYDDTGRYVLTLDGTEGAGRFNCPHGIWFDYRKRPMQLYIADRGNRRVQVYDDQGRFLRCFGEDFLSSPDGFAADGDQLIVPELRGRVTVLDANDRLVCHLGANEEACSDPSWPNGNPLILGKFNSPHAAATDADGNVYVVEWRVGGRILKLEKRK